MRPRWYAPLLQHSNGTSLHVYATFPKAKFFMEKQVITPKFIRRVVRFEVDGKPVVRARSEVLVAGTKPAILKELRDGKRPIGLIVKDYKVKRTRLRATSRTREFHFTGDLDARITERFFVGPHTKTKAHTL
ncbi:MAG: hypothetical protein IPJ89_01015 [Candidatus Iainarchaeum archaeon]|uniref:Uncharacterized protein n=1 Tax=Candidatus Iainarchaeum sp. TaxID=3101447 RepID=A0A7T9DK56_9ARCH|nr:MAG: hypothetical protein IPJ89_01015 [Candidatus Diapherotrites archaeon]